MEVNMNTYRIKHFIPGRIRIKSFLIRKNPAYRNAINEALKDIKGIVEVSITPP